MNKFEKQVITLSKLGFIKGHVPDRQDIRTIRPIYRWALRNGRDYMELKAELESEHS